MLLVGLLTAFLLIVQASNNFQCVHIAPGISCIVQPGWAMWCGYAASFAWLALAIIAISGNIGILLPRIAHELHVNMRMGHGTQLRPRHSCNTSDQLQHSASDAFHCVTLCPLEYDDLTVQLGLLPLAVKTC